MSRIADRRARRVLRSQRRQRLAIKWRAQLGHRQTLGRPARPARAVADD